MNIKDYIDNFKLKISDANKKFSHVKKYAYFDKYDEYVFKYLAEWSENPKVLEFLACHPSKEIRQTIIHNPFTSYESLLYLLNDKNTDVIRHVLSYGRLEQFDFYVLSEKFHPDKDITGKKYEDFSKYLKLIKPTLIQHWVNSQSICLLHNHHVGLKAIQNINISDFRPFYNDRSSYNKLQKVKEKRIQEIKDNIHVSKRINPKDCMHTVQQDNYQKYKVKDWRKKNKQLESVFSSAENHLLKYISEAENNTTSTFSCDKKIAKSDKVSVSELDRLLTSKDKRMVRLALQNPLISKSHIEDNIYSHADILINNNTFFEYLMQKPIVVRRLELKDLRKLLMNYEDFSPSVLDEIISIFENAYGEVYEKISRWNNILLLVTKQKNVTSNNLKKLYDLVFTENTNISEKRSTIINAIKNHSKFK